jgi:hypothetical protein
MSEEEIVKLALSGPLAQVTVPQGALLSLRPLLVHAPRDLIAPLQWHQFVAP